MIVFRICHYDYSRDLSGKGAEQYGGRWNSKGVAMLYTGETRALCTAELAVRTPLGIVPENQYMVEITIPGSVSIFELPVHALPVGWNSFPHREATQVIGDQFIADRTHAIMRVPSVVVQGEFNFIVNPQHQSAKRIKVEKAYPFNFDQRLFKK